MNLLQRARRKMASIGRTYLADGALAGWLAPAFLPWLFPRRHRRPPNPADVRSVLVWNVDSFGDFLFVTPLLRSLRNGYPRARIELALNRACLPLAETNPCVDRLIPVEATQYYTGTGLLRMPTELRGRRYDVVAIAEMGGRPADAGRVIARRLQAGFVVSSNLGLLKKLPDATLPPNQGEYWPAYFLRLANRLGLPTPPATLELATTEADDDEVRRILGSNDGSRVVGLHPMVASYGMAVKKWPDESFVALGQLLGKQTPTRLIVTGSADEAEACERLAEQLRRSGADAVSVAGRLSLRGTAALDKRLDLLITGDTAALHLASAAGTPTVALFGGTDDRRLASPATIVVKQDLPCRPCVRYSDRGGWPKCHYDRPWCLHLIRPETVAVAVSAFVSSPLRTRHDNH